MDRDRFDDDYFVDDRDRQAAEAYARDRAEVTHEQILGFMYDSVEEDQFDVNRRMAGRAAKLADAFAFARSHPWIYVEADMPDAEQFAERSAVLEASLRFNLAESTLRSIAHTADVGRECLPQLWSRARDGFAGLAQVDAAIALLPRFRGDAVLIRQFDDYAAEVVLHGSPPSFRAKLRRAARRLAPGSDPGAHAEAFGLRRVIVEPVDDGMSWLHLYGATTDLLAIKRRATSTAKHLKRIVGDDGSRDARTRDQIRADLTVAWLRGAGTPTAVKTKVFVTVPLDALTAGAQQSVRRRGVALDGGLDLASEPQLLGHGAIDPTTARQLLLDAGRFTRVITDPVTGVILDMDRRSRLVTRAQREWLMLTHHLCVRDGCNRVAIDAEIDHWQEYHGPEYGATNIANLHPLCGSDHRLKSKTKLSYRRRPDGSVGITSPTGFATHVPWWRMPHDVPENPPF